MATTNIQGGSISTDPNAMTIGEYVLENIRRLNEEGKDESLTEMDRAIRRAQAANLQKFYDTQIKNVKSQNGGKLENIYANRMNNTFKNMFQAAGGIKFGELQGQKNQTQMELPEAVKQAMQSFVGSDQNKVANSDVLKEQVENIHDYDEGTAAGEGKNTEAAKKTQTAAKNANKLVNDVRLPGVAANPETNSTIDGWYTEEDPEGDSASTKSTPKDEDDSKNPPPKTEEPEGLNKLLLADMLMTGVRNALHYRPAFRTAYGEDIEGRDFGTEKSLAAKLAEENMKRGLERANMRKDADAKTDAEIANIKKQGDDLKFRKRRQQLVEDVSPKTESHQIHDSNILRTKDTAGSKTEFTQVSD